MNFKWIFILSVLSVTALSVTKAQNCYTCNSHESNEGCNQNVAACNENEASCASEIRFDNEKKSITKTCKQTEACESQTSQNENSCTTDTNNYVCYYCCQGDLCNVNDDSTTSGATASTTSLPTTTTTTTTATTTTTLSTTTQQILTQGSCVTLTAPRYGSISCTDDSDEHSRCTVVCDEQYEIDPGTTSNHRCVCEDEGCFWTGTEAKCIYSAPTPIACDVPDFTRISYGVVDVWPNSVLLRVSIKPTTTSYQGWSFILMFSQPLPEGISVMGGNVILKTESEDNRILTFNSMEVNKDISNLQSYDVYMLIQGLPNDINPAIFSAMAGFYDKLIFDGSCIQVISPVQPLPTTTTTTTTTASTTTGSTTPTLSPPTTTSSTTTTTTTSTTTTTTEPTTTTTTTTETTLNENCEALTDPEKPGYIVLNPGWNDQGWKFTARLEKYPENGETLSDWTFKVQFSEAVDKITTYVGTAKGPYSRNRVWLIKPKSWNSVTKDDLKIFFSATMEQGTSAPEASVIFCRNGADPGTNIESGGAITQVSSTTSTTTTSTSSSNQGQTTSTASSSNFLDSCKTTSPFGSFPPRSAETDASKYNPSPVYSADEQNSVTKFDYNEVLHKSILFYEAQRSGKLPSDNRILWRGDSGLKDGCDVKVDLTGGFYDAGDNVKFGFPMAYTITVLSWGMIEFKDAYVSSGDWQAALDIIKWGTDYFIKAHPSKYELYVQVGDANKDHSQWLRPEDIDYVQTSYKIDKNKPGSEVAAETAAAMAAASILFRPIDSSYADTLVKHAKDLFDFATTYQASYHVSIPEVTNYYKSWSGYNDELQWAAVWLYQATNEQTYLNWAKTHYQSFIPPEFSWDHKLAGVQVLLAQITGETKYTDDVKKFIQFAMGVQKTPDGLTWKLQWGSNRYAANFAFIAVEAAKVAGLSDADKSTYLEYARSQINYMLGLNEKKKSYVIGRQPSPPSKPHHRASSCPAWTSTPVNKCGFNSLNSIAPNPHILYGALVGGPNLQGQYTDDRSDFISNEVAMDYNAGFQSAVAGLQHFALEA